MTRLRRVALEAQRLKHAIDDFRQKRILVYGGGTIGLSVVSVLNKVFDCQHVQLFDPIPYRMEIARKLGAAAPEDPEWVSGTHAQTSGNYRDFYHPHGKNELGYRHYGFTSQGAYAEYNAYATLAITKIPDNLSYNEATMCDTGGIALHGIELSGITPGGNVVIFGPGPVGMMIQLFAKSCGAGQIIMIGRGQRLEMAQKMGADHVWEVEKFLSSRLLPTRFR